jgi:hypothetical protein
MLVADLWCIQKIWMIFSVVLDSLVLREKTAQPSLMPGIPVPDRVIIIVMLATRVVIIRVIVGLL